MWQVVATTSPVDLRERGAFFSPARAGVAVPDGVAVVGHDNW